jgi:hypothetical protein
MFYEQDIGQDIAVPGIDDPTPTPLVTCEGTGHAGTAGILTREGGVLDNTAVPDVPVPDNEPYPAVETRTRAGRTVKPPDHIIEEIGVMAAAGATAASMYKIELIAAKENYYATMKELEEHSEKIKQTGKMVFKKSTKEC